MKKIIKWLSLLTIVLGFLIPSVQAANAWNDTQIIVNSNGLEINATSKPTNKGISWTIDYHKETDEKQRLKFRLTSENQEVFFSKKREWQQTGEWFTELNPSKSSSGSISVITEQDLSELLLEVQVDTEEKENILPDEVQGPYDLKLSAAETTETTAKALETSNSNLNIAEKKIKEDVNQIIQQQDHHQFFSLEPLISKPYEDPFNYSSTKEGLFPKNWTNEYINDSIIKTNEEDTTRNFDYGKKYNDSPVTKNIIGGNNNFLNGYHEHPNLNKPSDRNSILTKKIVKPTANPNQFEVSLDLIAGVSEIVQPVDVVFVIDKSGSMGFDIKGTDVGFDHYNSRWQMTKRALDKLSNSLLSQRNDVRLSAVSFGSDWNNANTAVWAENSNFNGSPFTTNAATFMNNTIITTNPKTSGTPTYLGVELGTKILQENARPEAKKFLIVLTDGMATFYPNNNNPKGISSATVTNTTGKRVFKLTSGNFLGDGTEAGQNPKNSYDGTISYLQNRIYNHTYYANVNEFSKYAIGLGATGRYIPGTLSAIGLNGEFDAQSESDLNKAIDSVSRVIRGYEDVFTRGTATDPMSEYVDLVGGNVSNIHFDALTLKEGSPNELQVISQNEPNFPVYAQVIKSNTTFKNNTIELSEINLSGSETERTGIRFTYTVELKEEFRDGKFYPANGPTSAKAFNHEEPVSFAVPSIRANVFDLPIIKNWEDNENHWNKRQDITIHLEFKVGSGNWTKVTGKTVTIPKDVTGKDLEHVFSSLAKKDPLGQLINYRVVETSAGNKRVLGYHDPSYDKEQVNANTENKLITIRNKLMSTPIEFTKVNGGKEKLEGVIFTLSAEGKTDIIQEVTSDKDGRVSFDALPIGKYVLTEKVSLAGYEPIKPIQVEIRQDKAAGNLEVLGLPKNNEIVNDLKDFELKVTKVDQDNQPVAGVEFELINIADGTKVTLQADKLNGNLFTFKPLKPGEYELKETVTPNNYVALKQPLKISISEGGKGTVDGKDGIAKITLGEKNTIEIQITNTLKGLLPSTGGSGTRLHLFATAAISLLLASVGVYYFYRNHKGGRVK